MTSTLRLSASGVPDGKQLNFGTAGRGSNHRQRQRGADVGLVGGNIIAAGDGGAHAIGIERGGADAQAAHRGW